MRRVLSMIMVLLFVASVGMSGCAKEEATGPASDAPIFKEISADLAGQAIEAGDLDYYIYPLTLAQAEANEGAPNLTFYHSPSSLVTVLTNPAPAPEGQLNPLSIREVRFALNYLVDREHIVNQIYKGFAAPMVTFLSTYEPDFVTIEDIVAEHDFKYDPATASAMIDEATQLLTELPPRLAGDEGWLYRAKTL